MANLEALVDTLTETLKTRTTEKWLHALESVDVPLESLGLSPERCQQLETEGIVYDAH